MVSHGAAYIKMKKHISEAFDIEKPTEEQSAFIKDFFGLATEKSKIIFIGETTNCAIIDELISCTNRLGIKPTVFSKSDEPHSIPGRTHVAKLKDVKIPFAIYVSIDDHSYISIQRNRLIGYLNNKDTAAQAAKVAQLLASIAF